MFCWLLPQGLPPVFPGAKSAFAIIVLALSILFSPMTSQSAYQIWKIADQNTKIPGFFSGNHYFTELGVPAIDGSDVVWYGHGELDNVFGIFIHDGSSFTSSSVHVIVTSLTYVPSENVQFTSYGKWPSIQDRYVTFLGRASGASFSGEVGVYDAQYNGISLPGVYTIADRGSPGLNSGIDMSDPDGSYVPTLKSTVFLASFVGSDTKTKQGVFTDYGLATLFKLADSDTNRPGSTNKFANFNRRPSIYSNKVLLYGQDITGNAGVYLCLYPFSNLITVADYSTKAPGSNSEFRDFQSLSMGNSQAAFYGQTVAGRGIYTAVPGGALKKVVDQSDFALIEPMVATRDGRVAFVGGPGYPGLYHQVNGKLELITDSLSSLDGKSVSLLKFGPQGLGGYNLAFWVRFSDHSTAIYRADRLMSLAYSQNEPLVLAISEEEYLAGNPATWNLAISGDDLGLARPLWVEPAYAPSHLIKVHGQSIYQVTPPEGVDPENIYQLVVFDPDTGEMLADPVEVPGGAPVDFRELGFGDGVQSFAIRGATLDENYRGKTPVGLVFSRADAVVNVEVRRCASEFERCGEE
jgi:hypothetical protein